MKQVTILHAFFQILFGISHANQSVSYDLISQWEYQLISFYSYQIKTQQALQVSYLININFNQSCSQVKYQEMQLIVLVNQISQCLYDELVVQMEYYMKGMQLSRPSSNRGIAKGILTCLGFSYKMESNQFSALKINHAKLMCFRRLLLKMAQLLEPMLSLLALMNLQSQHHSYLKQIQFFRD